LSLLPAGGGMFRLFQLTTGTVTEANARFFDEPIPVILHIIAIVLYSVLGSFQFSRPFRHKHPRFHRTVGKILIPSAFIVALTGLWMTLFYDLPPLDGTWLNIVRIIVGLWMLYSLVFAVLAIRKRQFREHGKWMMRAYAIAMAATVQPFTSIPMFLLDKHTELIRFITMVAGWLIAFLFAEWVISRGKY